jgi:four helix bundle protein
MLPTKPRDLCDRTLLFARDIVQFCRALAPKSDACRQIARQLLRSGTAVGANAEEAKAAYTRREFACKNAIVLREARESRFWLRLIIASALASEDVVTPLLNEANELVAIYTVTVKRAKQP